MPGNYFTLPVLHAQSFLSPFVEQLPTVDSIFLFFFLPLLPLCDHISPQYSVYSCSFLLLPLVNIMASEINDLEYFVYPDGEIVYLIPEAAGDVAQATVASQLKTPASSSPRPAPHPNNQGDVACTQYSYDDNDSVEFKTVSGAQLVDVISHIIDEVNVIANLPYTVTRMLLAHFNWDEETFLDRYYACADDPVGLKKLFTDAHIAITGSMGTGKLPSTNMTIQSDEMTCAICFDSFTSESSASLDCGHSFCKSCWVLYLTEKILDQGEAHYISCPDPDCHVYVDDRKVLSLIEDKRTRSKYIKLIINQFVIKNKRLRWCPTVDCASAIELAEIAPSSSSCLTVKCSNCNREFCFCCLEDPHEPVTCANLSKWKAKIEDKDHVESMNYINGNTKDCPKCKVAIEKDGGCK